MPTFTGDQIAAERQRRGWSRRQMSDATGLSQGVIKNLEDGRAPRDWEVAVLEAFVAGQEVTPDMLGEKKETRGRPPKDGTAPQVKAAPAPKTSTTAEPVDPNKVIATLDIDEDEDDDDLATVLNTPHDFSPESPAEEPEDPPVVVAQEDLEPLAPPAVPVVVGRKVSNSEVQAFKRCKRKWWLAWYRHLRLKREHPVGARAIGTWVHLALAQWYVPEGITRTDPRESLERVLLDVNTAVHQHAAMMAENADDGGFAAESLMQAFKKDADLARAMVEGYVQWLAETGADSDLTVIASEQMIAAEFNQVSHTEPVHIVGKLDVRVRRNMDDARMFMDHKTVASIDKAQRGLHMNEQMLQYLLLERLQPGTAAEGEFVGGALYNMLRKVKRTANAKPPFYQRVEVRHTEMEITSYVNHLRHWLTHMLASERSLNNGDDHQMVVPPTPAADCSWSCDFYAVCPMFDDGSRAEDMLTQYYEEVAHLDYYGDSLELPVGSDTE